MASEKVVAKVHVCEVDHVVIIICFEETKLFVQEWKGEEVV